MISRASFTALALLACLAPACSLTSGPPTTGGELGRTDWEIDDGLCGGGFLGNVCNLEVPIAAGAEPRMRVHPRRGTSLAGVRVRVGDAAPFTPSYSAPDGDTNEYIAFDAESAGEGPLVIEILDATDAVVDRARLDVRTATALECGRLRTGDSRTYELRDLVPGATSISRSAETADRRLACRALDSGGDALLSVRAIHWSVVEGDATVHDDQFTETAEGATIEVRAASAGSAVVAARLGSVEQRIDVEITP